MIQIINPLFNNNITRAMKWSILLIARNISKKQECFSLDNLKKEINIIIRIAEENKIPFNFGDQTLNNVLKEFSIKRYIIKVDENQYKLSEEVTNYIEKGNIKNEIQLWLGDYFQDIFAFNLYNKFN